MNDLLGLGTEGSFPHLAFRHAVSATIVSGQLAWHQGRVQPDCQGLPLRFMR